MYHKLCSEECASQQYSTQWIKKYTNVTPRRSGDEDESYAVIQLAQRTGICASVKSAIALPTVARPCLATPMINLDRGMQSLPGPLRLTAPSDLPRY